MMLIILIYIWIDLNFVAGTDYLIAVHSNSFKDSIKIETSVDETGGSVMVTYPNHNEQKNMLLSPNWRSDINLKKEIGTGTTLGYDYNAIILSCSNNATTLKVNSDNFKRNAFSPLPETALGKRYVVSSCSENKFGSLLVVAAFRHRADVNIKFKAGVSFSYDAGRYKKDGTLVISLEPYQTFTLKDSSDLSGTTITSSEIIAVFSGSANSTFVNTYTQLLPVEQFSKEYVLSVDDHESPYHLQVVSPHKGFEITFNNGTSSSTNGTTFDRQLEQNETFRFVSTEPVMVTLCRKSTVHAGFALLPPVSSYPSQKRIPVKGKTVIVTLRTSVINVTDKDVTSEWKTISNFNVGILSSKYLKFINTDERSYVPVMILSFGQDSFSISGVSSMYPPNIDETRTYLVVVPQNIPQRYITAVGSTEATYQVWCPHKDIIHTRKTHSHMTDRFYIPSHMTTYTGIENKTIIVKTTLKELNIFLQSKEGRRSYMSVPILPANNLGKTYIIPYDDDINYRFVQLIITTEEDEVDVNVITAGKTLTERLGQYQTYSVQRISSGTVVSATRNIAVYLVYRDQMYTSFFKQLMPNTRLGMEYVASIGNMKRGSKRDDIQSEEYYIMITCLHNGTEILFNDGNKVSVGKQFYRKELASENIYFRSSKPVMASLCLKLKHDHERHGRELPYTDCLILPPVELYDKVAVISSLGGETTLKIVTKQDNRDFQIELSQETTRRQSPTVSWENIAGTEYKIGTVHVSIGNIFMQSNGTFSVISYDVSRQVGYGGYKGPMLTLSTSLIIDAHTDPTLDSDKSPHAVIAGPILGICVLILLLITSVMVYRKLKPKWSKQRKTSSPGPSHEAGGTSNIRAPAIPGGSRATTAPANRANPTYSDLTEEGAGDNTYEPLDNSKTHSTYMNFHKK